MDKTLESVIVDDPSGDLINLMREKLSKAIGRATNSIESYEENAVLAITYPDGSRALTVRLHCMKVIDSLNERFELRAGIALYNVFVPIFGSIGDEARLEQRFRSSLRKGTFERSAAGREEFFTPPESPIRALRKVDDIVIPYLLGIAKMLEEAQDVDPEESFDTAVTDKLFKSPIQGASHFLDEIFEKALETADID